MICFDEFYANIKEFPVLVTINISKKIEWGEYQGCDVLIELYAHSWSNDKKMIIRCKEAREIKIKNIDGLFCPFFEITDISNRQLENIRYSIVDVENDMISLLCNEINFEIKNV